MEALEDAGPAIVADGEPAEAADHASVRSTTILPAQALAALDPTRAMRGAMPRLQQRRGSGDRRSLVGVEFTRALARTASALPDRRHGVERRLQHGAVVDVGV